MDKRSYILLVDDNLTTINLNKLLIEKVEGSAELLTATDGKAALALLQNCVDSGKQFPTLILVDLKMPVMDGLEFYKNFKTRFAAQMPETKVVMLTTSLNPKDLKEAREIGITYYLNKPLTTQKLQEVIA